MNCQGNHNSRQGVHVRLLKEVTALNSDLLDCIEINPSGEPTATIIWLQVLKSVRLIYKILKFDIALAHLINFKSI
jgi:hypothetical protein